MVMEAAAGTGAVGRLRPLLCSRVLSKFSTAHWFDATSSLCTAVRVTLSRKHVYGPAPSPVHEGMQCNIRPPSAVCWLWLPSRARRGEALTTELGNAWHRDKARPLPHQKRATVMLAKLEIGHDSCPDSQFEVRTRRIGAYGPSPTYMCTCFIIHWRITTIHRSSRHAPELPVVRDVTLAYRHLGFVGQGICVFPLETSED